MTLLQIPVIVDRAKDEKGKVIGLGTIAKKLGISKDKLSYLFRKYENNQL